ncbi:MAG: caspase family protein [Pseudomonadota bacterium]
MALAAQARIALVVGNSDYSAAEFLPNAAKDAEDVGAALERLGFTVFLGTDLTRREMLELVVEFRRGLRADDTALLYFSGHGIQLGATNYLMPVDAAGDDEEGLRDTSVSLQALLADMERRAVQTIVILDACRNNPFSGRLASRSVGGPARGLARIDAGVGSFIAFSTQPGNVALDGAGLNSPFTASLLRHIETRGLDLHEVMRRVRADVVDETDALQIPWENSSLIDRVYLAGLPSQQSQQLAPAPVARPPVAAAAPFTHVVQGLDPNGDGFLALRTGTHSGATRLAKMTEGTRLRMLNQSGRWMEVETETGLRGWAHTNWIASLGAIRAQPAPEPTLTRGQQCEALWLARNQIFADYGYCFQSARGKAAFGHLPCEPALAAGDVPLTSSERARISQIRSQESALGC